jgi:hypothetical protein
MNVVRNSGLEIHSTPLAEKAKNGSISQLRGRLLDNSQVLWKIYITPMVKVSFCLHRSSTFQVEAFSIC